LRDVHEAPRLFYNLTQVLGIPGRRLGNRITINDSEVMSAARDAFVIGIQWTFSKSGFTQDIEAVDAAAIYQYTLDEYFVIDTDELGGTKRLFY
jgi:hypothetical protein